MNINEMAREAEEFAAQNAVYINKTYPGSEVRDFEYHDLLYRKFAELIIKECVGILDDEDDYGPYSAGVRSAAYRIKKRFGVDEKIRERGTT